VAVSIAGNATAAEPAATAEAVCALNGEGSIQGSVAACAQGYEGAKAGKTEEAACDTIGSGAVIGPENVKDCQEGWAAEDVAGKGAATTPGAAAETTCSLLGEGSIQGSVAACAQGYEGAKAGKSQQASCDSIGYGAVVGPENIKDCQEGWSAADVAGKGAATTPSAAAEATCSLLGEGSIQGSVAACAQGYDAAKAGTSEEASCDSIGFGAVVGPENIKDCQSGWSAG
jgi:hypothetical protein